MQPTRAQTRRPENQNSAEPGSSAAKSSSLTQATDVMKDKEIIGVQTARTVPQPGEKLHKHERTAGDVGAPKEPLKSTAGAQGGTFSCASRQRTHLGLRSKVSGR